MDVGPLPRRREDGAAPLPDRRGRPSGAVLHGPVPSPRGSALRRTFDIVGSVVLLVFSLPVLLVGVVSVWRVAGRPVFFAHRRIGKGGRAFPCWKLRTMEREAEKRLWEDRTLRQRHRTNGFKLPEEEDPRVIPGTTWLRRSHVDEIPQLVNVIRGDMSLVGPRPVVREELACFGEEWRTLLSRRPGMVGAWTAQGPDRPGYPERARLELDYVRNAGFRTDATILLRTALAPFRRRVGG